LKSQIRQIISRPSLQPLWLQILKLCHAGLNYGGGQSVEWSGESGALRFALRSIASPPYRDLTLFDVGANNGEYLEVALKELGTTAKIFSFEPQRSSFELLRLRFADNPHVQLRNAALGKESASAKLFFSDDHQSTASMYESSVLGSSHFETIRLITLDQFCHKEGIEKIDILKIDTEGHEMDVLLGASNLLESGGIAAIQFEFGETFLETKYHLRDIFDLLVPRYDIYRVLKQGLSKVSRYSPDLEIYKIANFMCIRR
jgi:FkbM family methyltransferase